MTIIRRLDPAGPHFADGADDDAVRAARRTLTRQMDAMTDEGGTEGAQRAHPDGTRATGAFGAMAEAGGDAMRSMAMDPGFAARQAFGAVRRHPYVTAVLLLGLGALILGLARS
jgi:hypothetical protein